jgi:hypothetical protein
MAFDVVLWKPKGGFLPTQLVRRALRMAINKGGRYLELEPNTKLHTQKTENEKLSSRNIALQDGMMNNSAKNRFGN